MTFEDSGSSNLVPAAGSVDVPPVNAPSAPALSEQKAAPPPAPSLPPQIEDFDELIKKEVQNFVNLGNKIGGLVGEQVRYSYKLIWWHSFD